MYYNLQIYLKHVTKMLKNIYDKSLLKFPDFPIYFANSIKYTKNLLAEDNKNITYKFKMVKNSDGSMEKSIFSQNWFTKQKSKDDSGSDSERLNSDRSVKTTRTNITYVPSHKMNIRQRYKQYSQFQKQKKAQSSISDV